MIFIDQIARQRKIVGHYLYVFATQLLAQQKGGRTTVDHHTIAWLAEFSRFQGN
ncbi:Uncharacterised protein [Vibrio cholerae]|nr:Uncharacterised protein [Vibrio cholerae]